MSQLLGADYRLTDNRPVPYQCIANLRFSGCQTSLLCLTQVNPWWNFAALYLLLMLLQRIKLNYQFINITICCIIRLFTLPYYCLAVLYGYRNSSMVLLTFGPFSLLTERGEDDESNLTPADLEVSTACMLFIRLFLCLSFSGLAV